MTGKPNLLPEYIYYPGKLPQKLKKRLEEFKLLHAYHYSDSSDIEIVSQRYIADPSDDLIISLEEDLKMFEEYLRLDPSLVDASIPFPFQELMEYGMFKEGDAINLLLKS